MRENLARIYAEASAELTERAGHLHPFTNYKQSKETRRDKYALVRAAHCSRKVAQQVRDWPKEEFEGFLAFLELISRPSKQDGYTSTAAGVPCNELLRVTWGSNYYWRAV